MTALENKMKALSPERRKKIEARAAELIAEERKAPAVNGG